ncbi:MAG: YqaJ viral recombinase family protein [Alphaproteobacteria bacterium]|nr:YqaJ viral recombinase family protein [Alphaproteobacteria bacterium]
MTLTVHPDMVQGSDEWLAARCGLLTASTVGALLTAKGSKADNQTMRTLLHELLGQRITQYVEPAYVSDAMLRGHDGEEQALSIYHRTFAPVERCGFMTRDFGGVRIGYSPDALVGDDGLIEVKTRAQKHQIATIIGGVVPAEYLPQIQCGLLVSGRAWCDFISYCGGLPMLTIRVFPDLEMQDVILMAAQFFEQRLAELMGTYTANNEAMRTVPTERVVEQEMIV